MNIPHKSKLKEEKSSFLYNWLILFIKLIGLFCVLGIILYNQLEELIKWIK